MVKEIIKHQDNYYILVTSALADDRMRVLKHGDTFAVFNRYGDIQPFRFGEQGIYHFGTRYLSRLEFLINNLRPFLLSSSILEDNTLLAVDLTNPDITENSRVIIPRGSFHIFRTKFLLNGTCYERFRLCNYENTDRQIRLSLIFENDFADIFEVRGIKREKRGNIQPTLVDDKSVTLSYVGLDAEKRKTHIRWYLHNPELTLVRTTPSEILFDVQLKPKKTVTIFLRYTFISEKHRVQTFSYEEAFHRTLHDRRITHMGDCYVFTSNEQFNDWLNRSYADIHMMTTRLPEGFYPYAGVPWFSTVFGRDGIITALFYLWINPKMARGVLTHLSTHQAKEYDPAKDAEPGKILHESRKGEMAKLKEIPFGLYYGSVDATPLFVVLAGAYYERTGDLEYIKEIWPNIELALQWIKEYGDIDGDGFVEYKRRQAMGLINQGWKDSDNAIFHKDGTLAEGPIALCEVQGYVYDALKKASVMASALGLPDHAKYYTRAAQLLRNKFAKAFWSDEISMYALALDGEKRQCKIRSSNAGHCLFSGIALNKHAKKIAQVLMDREFFTGWGIRTVSEREHLYNPMSYHNGTVWPHDNAIIAAGLARYGFQKAATKVMSGFFDASLFMDLHRLPELFCGFQRRPAEGPTLYPVACLPQSWASASVFFFLRATLGLYINGIEKKIYFNHPILPEFLQMVTIKNIVIGKSKADIVLQKQREGVSINATTRKGRLDIIVRK